MVRKIPAMVNMARTMAEKEEAAECVPSPANQPDYPYGLSICLCQDELEKLDLGDEDIQVGDLIHLHCMAMVTSVSKNSTSNGDQTRVELQVTHIQAEGEDEENEEAEEEMKDIPSKLYR